MGIDPRRALQEGRILKAIQEVPMTAKELGGKLHMDQDSINLILRRMKLETPRRLYVSAWNFHRIGGRPAAVYAAGEGKDVPYISTRKAKLVYRSERVATTLKKIVVLLKEKSMTTNELAIVIKLSAPRARWYISLLRAPGNRQLYIRSWAKVGESYPAPVYATGTKNDAPLIPKTPRQYRAEINDDPERKERLKRKAKAREMIRQARSKPNTIFGALGL